MSTIRMDDPIAVLLSESAALLERAGVICPCLRKKVLRRYQQDTYATIASDNRYSSSLCLAPTPHRDAQGNVQGKVILRLRHDALHPASIPIYTEIARFLSMSDLYNVEGSTMARMVGVCEEQYVWRHDHYEKKRNRHLQLLNTAANNLLAQALYGLMEEKAPLSSIAGSLGVLRAYLRHDGNALAREMRKITM